MFFPFSFIWTLSPPRTLCLSDDLALIRVAIFRSARSLRRAFNAEWFFFGTLFRGITRWTKRLTGALRSLTGTAFWPIGRTLAAVGIAQSHFPAPRRSFIVLRAHAVEICNFYLEPFLFFFSFLPDLPICPPPSYVLNSNF